MSRHARHVRCICSRDGGLMRTPVARVPSTHASAPERPTILVVDDDDDLRAAVAEAIGDDLVVLEASHGVEALALMQDRHPDVVVLDLVMPVMDGWQVRVKQRGNPLIADIPIIAMSAI